MDKRQAIIVAAQETFGKYGYSATTMKQVAAQAGVAFGLLAHYFGSKENLFLTAGFAMADDLMAAIHASTEEAENGLDAVARYTRSYLAFTWKRRTTFPILIRCSPFSDVELPAERERIAKRFFGIIGTLEEFLERGVADGSITPVPPRETAFLIFGNVLITVRTLLITPYDVPGLKAEAVRYVVRSIAMKTS
jgi:AcrR family transcriptional regulator